MFVMLNLCGMMNMKNQVSFYRNSGIGVVQE